MHRPALRRCAVTSSVFALAMAPLARLLLAAFMVMPSFGAAQIGPMGPVPQAQVATVYRDEHGVPHITAENEETAWYALGYEQARDGLLQIQLACKAAKGEMSWAFGVAAGLRNDIAVQVFGAHLGGRTPSQLRALLAPASPAISANFYDNCVAFAAGADAYRQQVANASASTPPTPEYDLQTWLNARSLAWVHQDPIEAVDIASQGGWTTATMSLGYWTGPMFVNSSGPSYGDSGSPGGTGEGEPEIGGDPLAPGAAERFLDGLRQQLMALPGAPSAMLGSNSYCWSDLYCKDTPTASTGYPGLVGDPHHPAPGFSPNSFLITGMWVAHVRVTPPGATQPSLDSFGHVPHAAATFFSSHNRDVAMGGTLGAPNFVDAFVLRLSEDPGTGEPLSPMNFYSYYHDGLRPITTHSITIKRPVGTPVTLNYWRAESFGVILPDFGAALRHVLDPTNPNNPLPTIGDAVIYGERVDPDPTQPPPRFRASVRDRPPTMRYWASPQRNAMQQLITSPMVVTLRAPMDAAVAGEDMHWLLLRDFWEIAHAASVVDVIPRTNGAGYLVNVCFVDRGGATFSTQMSAIPKRGVDDALDAAEYTSFDKWWIYTLGSGPVPARHLEDRMFDWQFGTSGLEYLQYEYSAPVTRGSFKPLTLRFPGGGEFPQAAWTPSPGTSFAVESGGFVSVCNDLIWGFSRKRDVIEFIPDPRLQTPPQPLPFNDVVVTSLNQLLALTLDAGTLHQSAVFTDEGPDRQQIVVDQLTRQAERIVHGWPNGLPPLTPAEMRSFVVSPRLYNDRAYVPPGGIAPRPDLPTPIRQLRELVDHASHADSPSVAASKELQFFKDLWTALYTNPGWQSYTVQGGTGSVDLRKLWVDGGDVQSQPNHVDQVFWYDDPSNVSTLRWIDLPAEFPLIDFLWTESELGRGFTAGTAAASTPPDVLPQGGLSTLTALVNELETWEPGIPAADRYRSLPSSPGACLLQMMRMGYGGEETFARKWVRLRRGEVEYTGSGFVPLTPSGGLPSGTANLEQQGKPWRALEGPAFPWAQHATLFVDTLAHLSPPFGGGPNDAPGLYDPTGQVRATLRPEDINALVAFFLNLGGHYIDPAHNNGSPSRKLARFELRGSDAAEFMRSLPGSYPLTSGLARVTVARAVLDAAAFVGSPIPPFSQHFRARAYDHHAAGNPNPQPLWPQTGADADCVGRALRAVAWNEDKDPLIGWVLDRGYQPKFLGLGGSYATLLTLFPSQGDPESYFWCTPGVEAMGIDPARFDRHMSAFTTNALMRTHYSDFETSYVSVREHYYAH